MRIMLKKNVRGSISILLIIILIPMLAVASIIVDLSRYELSKPMVSSAGDLTMNATMTYYDEILKDVYGLFAVSPTEADLQANLYDYFVNSLMANGIISSTEEFEKDSNLTTMANIFSGNVGEVIDLEVKDTADVSVTGVSGTTIAQPEILKTQIVEFMKYRTPIYGALSMLDGLKSLKNLSNQNKVLEKETAVNEKISDFNEACENAYNAIKDMQDYEANNYDKIKWDNAYIQDIQNKYEVIDETVKYYGSTTIPELEFSIILTKGNTSADNSGNNVAAICSLFLYGNANIIVESSASVSGDDKYKVTPDNVSLTAAEKIELKNDNNIIIDKINATRNITDSKLKPLYEAFEENTSASLLKIYDITEIVSYLETYNSLNNMIARIDKYYDYLYENQLSEAINKEYEAFMQEVWEYGGLAWYLIRMIEEDKREAEEYCQYVKSSIAEKLNLITDLKAKIKTAYETIGSDESSGVRKQLSAVNTANAAFASAIDEYTKNGTDSFSDSMSDEATYNEHSFSDEEVKALYDELKSIESKTEAVEGYLNNVIYCGKAVKDISLFEDALNAYKNGNTGYRGLQSFDDWPVSQINENITFWRYLKKVFAGSKKDDNTADEKQGSASNIVSAVKDSTENALKSDSDVSIGTLSSDSAQSSLLPSQGNVENTSNDNDDEKDTIDTSDIEIDKKYKGFSNMLDNMSKVAGTLLSAEGITNALKAGRDNLYVTDYCFSMFSYYTYEKEVTEQTDRKTVTGTAINSENNQYYNGEIEYITFGGTDSVSKAKTYIFAIRFMCNAVYTVTSSSIDAYTVPPAMAIQAATLGIIPYKLPEIVFELAFALAESYVDMVRLGEGESVPLFKNSSTFTLSIQGALNAVGEQAKEELTKAATTAINKTTAKVTSYFNEVVDGAGTYVTSNIEGWVAEYKETVQKAVEDEITALTSKYIKSIIDQLGDLLDKPNSEIQNFNADTIINNAMTEINKYINTLDDGNVIKQIAQDSTVQSCLKSYANTLKDKINTAVDKVKTQSSDAYSYIMNLDIELAELLKSKVTAFLNNIQSKINNVVETKVSEYETTLKNEFGNAATVAADKVAEITNNAINGGVDTLVSKISISGVGSDSSTMSKNSLLSFSYKQYMEMFLFLKLCTDSDNVMLRIADVIQLNMAKQTNNSTYQLSSLYTYIQLNATVILDTMFISNTWFSNIAGGSLSEMEIQYTGIRGY